MAWDRPVSSDFRRIDAMMGGAWDKPVSPQFTLIDGYFGGAQSATKTIQLLDKAGCPIPHWLWIASWKEAWLAKAKDE